MSGARSITEVVPEGASVCIDTSVTLAYLTGSEAISAIAVELFDRCLATGRNVGVMSTISVTELLVRPFRSGPSAVSTIEGFLRHFADLRVLPVEYATAREAARIRAMTGLSTPDALVVASHAVGGTDLLVTNDASWPAQILRGGIDASIIVMGDLLPRSSTPRADRRGA